MRCCGELYDGKCVVAYHVNRFVFEYGSKVSSQATGMQEAGSGSGIVKSFVNMRHTTPFN
jgi:hypothetical protein